MCECAELLRQVMDGLEVMAYVLGLILGGVLIVIAILLRSRK